MKYRVGRKQNRAMLDENGLEVALFSKGQEQLAQQTCELLNEVKNLNIDDVSNYFSEQDLKAAWLHGAIRTPKEMKHINNFEAYLRIVTKE